MLHAARWQVAQLQSVAALTHIAQVNHGDGGERGEVARGLEARWDESPVQAGAHHAAPGAARLPRSRHREVVHLRLFGRRRAALKLGRSSHGVARRGMACKLHRLPNP